MALQTIIIAPDPRLKQISRPVARVDDALRTLMDDMLETMYAAPGIGLAAIQIGVAKQVITIDLAHNEEAPEPLHLVNPEITWYADEKIIGEEGCLSVPEQYYEVERSAAIKLRYLDYDGNSQTLHTEGMLATCIQHEIDHLGGVLFIDHLSALKRNMILRRLAKARKLQETSV